METELYYIAKDGKKFTDPYLCEQYEKEIGEVYGSIGRLIVDLEKISPEDYVSGAFICSSNGKKYCQIFNTVCIDDKIDSFVNVENLRQEQRYIKTRVKTVIETLRHFPRESQCQYMFILSDSIDMNSCRPFTNWNIKLWEEFAEIDKKANEKITP